MSIILIILSSNNMTVLDSNKLSVCFEFITGLMADKLGSYTVTFYTAGAILIAEASITSLTAFVKQCPEEAEEMPSYDEKFLVTEKITVV